MDHQENRETIDDVTTESIVRVKEEEPDLSNKGENIVDFEEDVIRFIKPEQCESVVSDIEEEVEEIISKELKVILKKLDYVACIACDRYLVTSEPMMVYKHNNEMVLFCYDCYKPKGKEFTCMKCSLGFNSRLTLIDHVTGDHRQLKKYKCGECDKAFAQKGILKKHVESVHSKIKYECQECNKSYCSLENLNIHVNLAHRKSKEFPCSECNKPFRKKQDYLRHINGVHRKMKEYECDQCKKAFFDQTMLTRHVNCVHLKLKPFECDKCKCYFGRRSVLIRHINEVHLKTTVICAQCNKSFSRKENLITHINFTHLAFKPFPTLLGKKYKCDQCRGTFVNQSSLTRHVNRVHLKSKFSQKNKCDQCKRAFVDLTRHVNTVHSKLKPFECKVCNRHFGRRDHLTRHNNLTHLNIKFVCADCNKLFTKKATLITHIRHVRHAELKPSVCKNADELLVRGTNLKGK